MRRPPTLVEGATPLPHAGPDGSVALWLFDLRMPHDPRLLDPVDRRHVESLRTPVARRRLASSRALVRLMVGSLLDVDPITVVLHRSCERCGEHHGRARLAGPWAGRLHLSTSRSGDHGLLAVSPSHAVGVDVERLRPVRNPARLAAHSLTPAEARVVERAGGTSRGPMLLAQWARKEAVVKATGAGLPAALRRYAVIDGPDPRQRVLDRAAGPRPATGWWLEDLSVGLERVAALAVRTAEEHPVQSRVLMTGVDRGECS